MIWPVPKIHMDKEYREELKSELRCPVRQLRVLFIFGLIFYRVTKTSNKITSVNNEKCHFFSRLILLM